MRAATLLYHDVVEDGDFESSGFRGAGAAVYKLRVADFASHLEAIAARVEAAPARVPELDSKVAGPAVPWLLTFDDGGASALDPTAGLLEDRGWRGHFFVTASRVGRPGFLDGAAVRSLAGRGHIVGSHSWSHPARFSSLSPQLMREEWRRSVDSLQEITGAPVTAASVPGGFYSDAVAEAAAEVGIRHLFTSEPILQSSVVDGCRVLGRLSLRRTSSAWLAASFAAGQFAPRAAQWVAWNGRKAAKRLAGPAYEAVRERLLPDPEPGSGAEADSPREEV